MNTRTGKMLKTLFSGLYVIARPLLRTTIQRVRDLFVCMSLRRVDKLEIPHNPDKEIRMFMVVRNEILRLPFLFKYYAERGVDRFFVVDNDSTDGTLAFLLEQENTHVFHTRESYGKFNCGQDWNNFLLHKHGIGYWCLVGDADEIFLYPYHEVVSIRALTEILDAEGSDIVGATFLDMYSDKPICSTEYKSGDDPLLTCSYFDKQDCSDPSVVRFLPSRNRLFGIKNDARKIPLVKYRGISRLGVGCHTIAGENVRFSEVTGVVLHFKFIAESVDRFLVESSREEHWNKAHHYKCFAKAIAGDPYLSMYYHDSVRYVSSEQLVGLGMMHTSRLLDELANSYSRSVT